MEPGLKAGTQLPDSTGNGKRFQVTGRLADGGQAELYRAEDLATGELVVVKVYKLVRFTTFIMRSDRFWQRYIDRLEKSFAMARDLHTADGDLVMRPIDFVKGHFRIDLENGDFTSPNMPVPFAVYSYAPLGDLHNVLAQTPPDRRRLFGMALLTALLEIADRLHQLGCCHGDLCFKNLVRHPDAEGTIGLRAIDLDAAHGQNDHSSSMVGIAMHGWIHPEHDKHRRGLLDESSVEQIEFNTRCYWEICECAGVVRQALLRYAPGFEHNADGNPETGLAFLGDDLYGLLNSIQNGEFRTAAAALERVRQTRARSNERWMDSLALLLARRQDTPNPDKAADAARGPLEETVIPGLKVEPTPSTPRTIDPKPAFGAGLGVIAGWALSTPTVWLPLAPADFALDYVTHPWWATWRLMPTLLFAFAGWIVAKRGLT